MRRNLTARGLVSTVEDKQVMQPAASTEEASQLCRSCGLCCNGVLHGYVKLVPAEVGRIKRLGLAPKRIKGNWALPQPCPCLADTGCTVYADRPSVCRRYRCKLLKEFLNGRVDQDKVSITLKKVWGAVRNLKERLGIHDPKKSLWRSVQELTLKESPFTDPKDFRHKHAPMLLDLITLRILCDRYFDKPDEKPLQCSPERRACNKREKKKQVKA